MTTTIPLSVSATDLSSPARRSLFKVGGATVAAAFAPHVANGQVAPVRPPSPTTRPWAMDLPVQQPIRPESGLDPVARGIADAGECGRANHQAWARFPPQEVYRIKVEDGSHSFHPDLPDAQIWGYNGQFPGPLFHARYGRPILVRFENKLPNMLQGYGSPDISVHLHNLHTPSESDGYPLDWFSETAYGETLSRAGRFKDHHYPMVYAGLDTHPPIGDPREALGTMWYHDHRDEFTAPNVYRGMAGFFLAFDHIDTGNENDRSTTALRLPSGEFDVPLMIADKQFDSGGYLMFDQFNGDGFVGDKTTVNGKIQPVFRVAARKYRFRILDASTSRVMDLQVMYQNRPQGFQQISSDGNLFLAPISRSNVQLGAAERADLVVDFAKFPIGSELYLVNRLTHLNGTKPEKDFLPVPTQLQFVVDRPAPGGYDPSRVPIKLRDQPPIELDKVVATREFLFDRSKGGWTINDKLFDNKPLATPKMGTAEIWNLRNVSGGWAHPVHIHFEEGRILKRNGGDPPPWERGRKDVFFLGPNESVSVFLRFRDFPGKYIMHCHNTIHEDHAMMGRYDILP